MADEQTTQDKREKPLDEFLEHQKRALDEASKALDSLIPPEFREHGKAAVNESIEGFRILVNSMLDDFKTEVNKDGGECKSGSSGSKVKVEVN
jgi:hypothetical protein